MPQQAQIVVGIVKHEFDAGVCQQLAEPGEPGDRERVDQPGLGAGRELQEIDPVAMAMEAGGFGIHSDQQLDSKTSEQLGEVGGPFDQLQHPGAHLPEREKE